jgi:hypothetical protein
LDHVSFVFHPDYSIPVPKIVNFHQKHSHLSSSSNIAPWSLVNKSQPILRLLSPAGLLASPFTLPFPYITFPSRALFFF